MQLHRNTLTDFAQVFFFFLKIILNICNIVHNFVFLILFSAFQAGTGEIVSTSLHMSTVSIMFSLSEIDLQSAAFLLLVQTDMLLVASCLLNVVQIAPGL